VRAVAVTVLISSLLGCAGSAQAQAGPASDVRCFLTMAAISGNKANQPQATFGLFYFAGRIKVQAPAFNFGTDLKPTAAKMTKQDLEAEVKRCGPMVQSAVQGLQAAQAALAPPAAQTPPAAPAAPAPAPAKK
jgi:hypothetical protein